MNPPIDAKDASARIASSPRPVVLLDTAALLDLLRIPYRPKLPVEILREARRFVAPDQTGSPPVWLVVSETVHDELTRNRPEVEAEFGRWMRDRSAEARRLSQVQNEFGPAQFTPAQWSDGQDLRDCLTEVLESLLGHAILIAESNDVKLAGLQRMREGRAPAQKGQGATKDCLIFEAYLALMREIRRSEIGVLAAFVTPNTNDYGPIAENGFPAVQADLAQWNVHYCVDLCHAAAKLFPRSS